MDVRAKHFEKIGLQQKLFSRQQVIAARRAVGQTGDVGQELVRQGILGQQQLKGLERAVAYRIGRDEDKEIAKVIIDSSYCSAEAVEDALRKQKDFYAKTGELMRLGVLLVRSRELSESQAIAARKIYGIEQQGAGY